MKNNETRTESAKQTLDHDLICSEMKTEPSTPATFYQATSKPSQTLEIQFLREIRHAKGLNRLEAIEIDKMSDFRRRRQSSRRTKRFSTEKVVFRREIGRERKMWMQERERERKRKL